MQLVKSHQLLSFLIAIAYGLSLWADAEGYANRYKIYVHDDIF